MANKRKAEESVEQESPLFGRRVVNKPAVIYTAGGGGAGLIFDSESAMKLRRELLIVGAIVGTLPGYRTQEQAHSLPVMLWPEEVLYALENADCSLVRSESACNLSVHEHADGVGAYAPMQSQEQQEADQNEQTANSQPTPRARGLPQPRARGGRPAGRHATPHNTAAARRWGSGTDGRGVSGETNGGTNSSAEPWQRLIARTEVETPVRGQRAMDIAVDSLGWPNTEQEWARWAVFRDLKRRGYAITSGAKFGADYLAYPHDPALYHATFSVRLCVWDTPLHPLTLAAATRMSHAARKHVLLASARWDLHSVQDISEPQVDYIAVGPDVSLSSQRSFREGQP